MAAGLGKEKAAVAAGYSSYRVAACKLMRNPAAIAEVARLKKLNGTDVVPRGILSRDEMCLELSGMARSTTEIGGVRVQAMKLLSELMRYTDGSTVSVGVQINLGSVEQAL